MALFPQWTNTVARITVAVLLVTPAAALGLLWWWVRTPATTNQFVQVAQPIQFDHRHHSQEEGIGCLYCHSAAETSAEAGIPTVTICVGCHGQVWNKSPRLEPVREAFFTGLPIPWVKVHVLPDFVYFDHSIHLAKGVGCVSCHGRVDQMATVYQAAPLTMQWCLECHRDPAPALRPKSELTTMRFEVEGQSGLELALAYDVHPRDSCDACHR
jgi:hypothetical protein